MTGLPKEDIDRAELVAEYIRSRTDEKIPELDILAYLLRIGHCNRKELRRAVLILLVNNPELYRRIERDPELDPY